MEKQGNLESIGWSGKAQGRAQVHQPAVRLDTLCLPLQLASPKMIPWAFWDALNVLELVSFVTDV